MSIKTVALKKYTADQLKPYGRLISLDGKSPAFKSDAFSFIRDLGIVAFSESVSFCMVESRPAAQGLTPVLEIHEKTEEVLIPTTEPVVLVLALGSGKPDLNTLVAFTLQPGTAFAVAKGIWHYAPISEKPAKTFIIFNQSTPDKDLIQVDLQKEFGGPIKYSI